MTTRGIGLNDQHDIYLNDAGDLVIVDDLAACMQGCETAILAQRAEMVFAMDQGIPSRPLVWDQYLPAQFEAAARAAISAVPGVVEITAFDFNRRDNVFSYTATIKTQWGIGVINGG